MAEERPWVCDRCELIGSQAEAERHRAATGHEVRPLNDDELAYWQEFVTGESIQRASELLAWARRYGMAGRETRSSGGRR